MPDIPFGRLLLPRVGMEKLRRFTALFYERCFVDSHLDQFIAEHSEPHAERFANWIAEALVRIFRASRWKSDGGVQLIMVLGFLPPGFLRMFKMCIHICVY